ncbi:MAG: glycosyltransferase [Thermoanaerobaculia bacterium]
MAGTERSPRFSVVIPAYNEEKFLLRLLDSIDTARSAYSRGANGIELIVADNLSTDGTARVAAARGCRVVTVEKRVIAAARNGGARASSGEILCFVDADMRIHPQTFDTIDRALSAGRIIGGATGVRLERWSAGIAVAYAMIVPWVWLIGIDTGVVFCRREDFVTVRGYDENRRLAEDVAFLLALKRLGRSRGQRLTRLRSAHALASLRKFDEFGDWHYVTMMPKLALHLLLRRGTFDDFADLYWYRPNR